MILPMYIYGQPVLRKVAEDITPDYPDLKQLIADMWETLAESEGIGLAAPQIGKAIRLSVIDLDVISDDLPEYKGFRQVYINPHIVEYDESKTDTFFVPSRQLSAKVYSFPASGTFSIRKQSAANGSQRTRRPSSESETPHL